MAKCDCYYQHGMKYLCYGTKEMEECSCGGDTSKCDFYPEKRNQKTMANEKRLIFANVLIDELKWLQENVSSASAIEIQEYIDRVNRQPTVDAVEVVHGRWEDMYGGHYVNPRFRCSVCKEKALYKFERDLLGSYKGVQALTPYCPYCMAKLDGGIGNDI